MCPKSSGLGLIQVYTGNGKGKTTAALGLALRAWGRGLRVCVIQFMKVGEDYGEISGAEEALPASTSSSMVATS